MKEKFFEKLEYSKILYILENFAKTYMGKELCLNLKPCFDKNLVIQLLGETTEAKELIQNNGSVPIEELPEMERYISG